MKLVTSAIVIVCVGGYLGCQPDAQQKCNCPKAENASTTVRLARARQALMKKDFAKIIEHLDPIPAENKSMDARVLLAAAWNNLGDYERALKENLAAIALKPESAALHYNSAQLHEALGDRKSAIKCLKKALKLNEAKPSETITEKMKADLSKWEGARP